MIAKRCATHPLWSLLSLLVVSVSQSRRNVVPFWCSKRCQRSCHDAMSPRSRKGCYRWRTWTGMSVARPIPASPKSRIAVLRTSDGLHVDSCFDLLVLLAQQRRVLSKSPAVYWGIGFVVQSGTLCCISDLYMPSKDWRLSIVSISLLRRVERLCQVIDKIVKAVGFVADMGELHAMSILEEEIGLALMGDTTGSIQSGIAHLYPPLSLSLSFMV